MRITENLSRGSPARSFDRDEQQGKKQPEDEAARKENAARYKENVDQVNRARDRDMERVLDGKHKHQ